MAGCGMGFLSPTTCILCTHAVGVWGLVGVFNFHAQIWKLLVGQKLEFADLEAVDATTAKVRGVGVGVGGSEV